MINSSVTLKFIVRLAIITDAVMANAERALGVCYAHSSIALSFTAFVSKAGSGLRTATHCSAALLFIYRSLVFIESIIFDLAGNVYDGSEVMTAIGRAAENSRWIR
jgi:hypothetical protein